MKNINKLSGLNNSAKFRLILEFQFLILLSFCVIAISIANVANADTITQGTLDIKNLAKSISDNLQDYTAKKNVLVGQIKRVQAGIKNLKYSYSQATEEKDRIRLRAETLKETSRLLNIYSKFYKLNISKAEAILPNIRRLKVAASRGPLGFAARQLENEEFKNNIKTFYSNISNMAILLNDAKLKKDVTGFLRDNDAYYKHGSTNIKAFDNITRNIDKIEGYIHNIYAKTLQQSALLRQKQHKTKLSIELMRYVIALRPLKGSMLQINPEGVMEVPEVNVDEFIDPLINEDQSSGQNYSSPADDEYLKASMNGPGFLED